MSDEIYASTESETRAKRAWGTGDSKANRAPRIAGGDDSRLSVTFAPSRATKMTRFASNLSLLAMSGVLTAACNQSGARESRDVMQSGSTTRTTWDSTAWRVPSIAELPADSLSNAVRRGLAFVTATPDSLPRFVGSNLSCTSCHLDQGQRGTAAPLTGVLARYPKYIDRTGGVASIEDRVNYCMTRSLAGRKLPNDSREMRDIVAYLAFMARGVPIGAHLPTEGIPAMPKDAGDTLRGAQVYISACARCHGADGAGMTNVAGLARVPALWGSLSFSIGASMARQERAASFIRHNMPFDKPGTLTDREAYDVAAYITSKPRPDLPEKARDWPLGGAPADVPYDTKGHTAFRPPPLLPRKNAADAVVSAPRPVTGLPAPRIEP
ncbi:MAG TPA: c-type cytochrome [Gemmatimonadaceae bacterium]|nr:c-type cytochrome [Gemmatimonadaceae bacterium]